MTYGDTLTLFDSLRDAQWAKFFNEMKCEFMYRPTKHLSKEYSASFYLPSTDLYIFTGNEHQEPIAFMNLVYMHSKTPRYTFLGDIPDPEGDWEELCKYDLCVFDGMDSNYGFCVCPKCNRLGFEYMGRAERICKNCVDDDKCYNWNDPRILNALRFARAGFKPYEIEGYSKYHLPVPEPPLNF